MPTDLQQQLAAVVPGGNILLLAWGAALVFSMHAGFAFLEAGSVQRKNVVNALTKIVMDWSVSTFIYFLIGFPIAYGISFLKPVDEITGYNFNFVHFFFLLTFAACIPAIISGGIAERSKFGTQMVAGAVLVGLVYPFYEALAWGQWSGELTRVLSLLGGNLPFHDYAGSVVVHAMGGWLALPAIWLLGPRMGRYRKNGDSAPAPIHSIPYVALGSWFLMVGWFGFNVASAGTLTAISGLVAINSLMAMVGGVVAACIASRSDSVAVYNGALAGLVAVCAGSDKYHPLGAAVVGAVAGVIFVKAFQLVNERWKIDDVLGVWPLHGLGGAWGGIAAGIFSMTVFGGRGGVSFVSQLLGTLLCVVIALVGGVVIYGVLRKGIGIRLTPHQELLGADLVVHSSKAYPEEVF
ncbi:MAG: ammonium transporter [Armatimonadota bacterium]